MELLFAPLLWIELAVASGFYHIVLQPLETGVSPLLEIFPSPAEFTLLASIGIFGKSKKRATDAAVLVQEQPGFHLGISKDVNAAGLHAAQIAREKYDDWLDSDWGEVDSQFKCDYFTIAVGGGNTVKAEYRALLECYAYEIDWLEHVRFFFLEESSNEKNWESSRDSLVEAFVAPLLEKLIVKHGARRITERLGLERRSSDQAIIQKMLDQMTYAIDMSGVEGALKADDRELALKRARKEARRYHSEIKDLLGEHMSFHIIISGIDKDGGIGAFSTYAPELKQKKPAAIALEKPNGAISVALSRGVMTAAECISLIISGSLKLKALGRFEMDEYASFEQTVLETPIRMLRESRQISEKVYIFADERALHFDEGLFQYQENGKTVKLKSEVRDGEEDGGIHILLIHGFMGLYSYINMLIRLPSAWKVSALHRGKRAKQLDDEDVFPHYANALRKVILQNWRYHRPTPVGCHSMAGVISDHLLLSVLNDYHEELPEFEQLKSEDQQLIQALRTGGIIHLATWAPTDVCHIAATIDSLIGHVRRDEPLSYGGPQSVYNLTFDGELELNSEHCDAIDRRPVALEKLMNFPGTEPGINALTAALRFVLERTDLQQKLSQRETPYALRLIGSRLLKKVSFYGLLKEVNASLHDPYEYQSRHFKALDAIVKYDIPYLAVIHNDDFMVSANRHRQEHDYLLAARMEKEGVAREQDLIIPAKFVLLEREEEDLPLDPLNPHLMLMSTSAEGDRIARELTSAITRFVNENAERAVGNGDIPALTSVSRWARKNKPGTRVAPRQKKARAAKA